MKRIFFIIVVFSMIASSHASFAAMTSSNYKIPSDILGSGGDDSSSSNYKVNDTLGETVVGPSSSTNYKAQQGFWNTLDFTISISCPATVTMGSIAGTGQSALATNSATCNVITDSPAGYQLSWKAATANMETNPDNGTPIGPYTPGGAPETWSVASSTSEWGGHLGASSDTVDTGVWGTADTYAGGNWYNVATTDYTIASRGDRTSPSGDDEIIFFGAEVGTGKIQPDDTYDVDVTLTALSLD
jgi:hypothetical protein